MVVLGSVETTQRNLRLRPQPYSRTVQDSGRSATLLPPVEFKQRRVPSRLLCRRADRQPTGVGPEEEGRRYGRVKEERTHRSDASFYLLSVFVWLVISG